MSGYKKSESKNMEAVLDKLTIKEAIKEGYTLCGQDGEVWQTVIRIEDLTDNEIIRINSRGKKLVLADKTPRIHTISAKDLREYVIDDYYNNDNFSQDDSMEIEHLFQKELPIFEEFAIKLNAIFAKREVWTLTKIELVPNGD